MLPSDAVHFKRSFDLDAPLVPGVGHLKPNQVVVFTKDLEGYPGMTVAHKLGIVGPDGTIELVEGSNAYLHQALADDVSSLGFFDGEPRMQSASFQLCGGEEDLQDLAEWDADMDIPFDDDTIMEDPNGDDGINDSVEMASEENGGTDGTAVDDRFSDLSGGFRNMMRDGRSTRTRGADGTDRDINAARQAALAFSRMTVPTHFVEHEGVVGIRVGGEISDLWNGGNCLPAFSSSDSPCCPCSIQVTDDVWCLCTLEIPKPLSGGLRL